MGSPKISIGVHLGVSGVIEIKNPVVTIEEVYWQNVTQPKKIDNSNLTATTGTGEVEAENMTSNHTTENPNTPANTTSNFTEIQYEQVLKKTKKTHEKKMSLKKSSWRPMPLSSDEKAASKTKLENMDKTEQEFKQVVGIKNELEASIYSSRDKMDREDIIKISTAQQREAVIKLCMEYEDFMYEPGSTLKDYQDRLLTLQDMVAAMEERSVELEARQDTLPELVDEVTTEVRKTLSHIKRNVTWMNPNKTEALAASLADFKVWWEKKLQQQNVLPLHEAPAFTKQNVKDKLDELRKESETLRKMKKPKEPKTKLASGDATEEPSLTPDIDALLKEHAEVKKLKQAAVAKEDFDTANKLKKRELKLKAKLSELGGIGGDKREL